MRIPPEKIDEIRNVTDIVELIGGFVKLRKRGKNYIGLCPFHAEKTPSFNVSPERQMYHCFGCGVGGNVFTFVMESEKVSFGEAVRSLADKAGIALPIYTPDQEIIASEQEQLYQVCRTAGLYYYHCLTETVEGKLALEYFHHRGFNDETIRMFGLGYAPGGWDAFIKHAEEKNFSFALLEQAGLARRREDGTYYDYFRGRAMFPIFSTTGRVIGFGARKLREDDPLGKYINSPETLIYNKSKVLYGISQSKESIRDSDNAILVEGYADLISVFQSGVKNVVASSGTALTQEQIQLVGRYTKNISIVYDADSAGSTAALRGVDLVLENDMDVRVVSLPQGDDPDSFVRRQGGKTFQELVRTSVSFIDFIAHQYELEGKFDTPEGKALTVRAIVQTIAKMPDELKRNFYIKQVAEKYKLYESTLYREMEKILGTRVRDVRGTSSYNKNSTGIRQVGGAGQGQATDIPSAERDLLHAMVNGGETVVRLVFEHLRIDDFSSRNVKALVEYFLQCMEEGIPLNPSSLVSRVEDNMQRKLLSEIVFSKHQISEGWNEHHVETQPADPRKLAVDAMLMIRRRAIEKMMEENQQLLNQANRRGEDVAAYLHRHTQLIEERKELQQKGLIGHPGQ